MKVQVSTSNVLISLSCIAVLGLAGLTLRNRQNTVLHASRQFVDALIRNDSTALAGFASKRELKTFGTSSSALQTFIETRALPGLKQNFEMSAILILQQSDHVEVYIPPKRGSNLSSGVKFKFTSGFETVESISYCYNWFMVDSTRFINSTGRSSIDTLNSFIQQIDTEQQYFESLGFRGIYSQASSKMETWQDRRAGFIARLQAMEKP